MGSWVKGFLSLGFYCPRSAQLVVSASAIPMDRNWSLYYVGWFEKRNAEPTSIKDIASTSPHFGWRPGTTTKLPPHLRSKS
jgi:hypothetical protein